MKKLALLTTLAISLAFPSTSFAEWVHVTESSESNVYVDFDRIKQRDGYVYSWVLYDHKKQNDDGVMSTLLHTQTDCDLDRERWLHFQKHLDSMGLGEIEYLNNKITDWQYFAPDTVGEATIRAICRFVRSDRK